MLERSLKGRDHIRPLSILFSQTWSLECSTCMKRSISLLINFISKVVFDPSKKSLCLLLKNIQRENKFKVILFFLFFFIRKVIQLVTTRIASVIVWLWRGGSVMHMYSFLYLYVSCYFSMCVYIYNIRSQTHLLLPNVEVFELGLFTKHVYKKKFNFYQQAELQLTQSLTYLPMTWDSSCSWTTLLFCCLSVGCCSAKFSIPFAILWYKFN